VGPNEKIKRGQIELTEPRGSEPWQRYKKKFEIMVIIGVAGELFADGGIFLFSRRVQTAFEHVVSGQSTAITGLTDQLKTTQDILSKAVANNAVMQSLVQSQSGEIERLRNKQDGPFTWSVSLVFPAYDSGPNGTATAPNIANFTPDKDITITRIVTPFAGGSFVQTPQGSEPCTHPPVFYLNSGPDRGVVYAAYVLHLPNGPVPGRYAVDSGPISVDFPAGVEITASYQVGFDATRVCKNTTNLGNMMPDNFTVLYWTREKGKHRMMGPIRPK
jgi:hypothetical protein